MSIRLVYDRHAIEDLKLLPLKTADRITAKIKWYTTQNSPLCFAKKLKQPFDGLYRFRIGEYRAIFEVTHGQKIRVLVVLRIKHRKDVY